MNTKQWQRRQVILAATAVAGVAIAGKVPGIKGLEHVAASDGLLQRVLQAIGEDATVDRLSFVDDSAVMSLLSDILHAPVDSSAAASLADLKHLIRRNIDADYRAGDTRIVNGWWLSRTEASCLELIERVCSPSPAGGGRVGWGS